MISLLLLITLPLLRNCFLNHRHQVSIAAAGFLSHRRWCSDAARYLEIWKLSKYLYYLLSFGFWEIVFSISCIDLIRFINQEAGPKRRFPRIPWLSWQVPSVVSIAPCCNFYPFVDESLFVEREYHEIYGDPIYDVYVYETMLMLLTAFSKKILLGIWIVQTLCKIELLKILDINRSKHVSSEDCLESIDKSQFGRQFVEDNSPLSAMNSTQPINQN
ncbi:unnamed protein product [Brassica napus]|uniref:(rape) hypothetical protein n=1 Tax=Brassica napus TaxID=3708 RepID=A0A816RFX8_BRANA|nr:unnamed protein product [Brassica napus]